MIDLGPLEDFPPDQPRVVTVDDREIGVIRWGDEIFAVRNICPHMFAPVCDGGVGPRIFFDEAAGDVQADPDRPIVACPWHGWEFDVRTGRSLMDPRTVVRTYAAWIENGRVLIDLGRQRAGP